MTTTQLVFALKSGQIFTIMVGCYGMDSMPGVPAEMLESDGIRSMEIVVTEEVRHTTRRTTTWQLPAAKSTSVSG